MANSQNAYVAQSIDGGVYWRGPLGTSMPGGDVDAAVDAALKDQGTCAQDGLSIGITRTSNTVKDFDGADFIDIQTEYNGEFKIKLLEFDLEDVKRTAFGDANVTVTPADATHGKRYHVAHNPDILPLSAHLFKTKYGAKRKNFEIAIGRVTEIAEFKMESQDATGLELTIKAFRNPATGNFVDEYGDDGAPLGGSPAPKVFTIGSGVTDYTATVDGQTTATISTMTAAALQTALRALSNVGSSGVTVTGSSGGPLTASFSVAVSTVTATGNGGTVTVA